jgi:hypothetical protein
MPVEFKKSFEPKLPDEIFRVNMRMYQPTRYMAMKRNQCISIAASINNPTV